MAIRDTKFHPAFLRESEGFESLARPREFKDTDPQMLFAIWQMEFGVDPDESLSEVEHAEVIYDKFRSGLSSRAK